MGGREPSKGEGMKDDKGVDGMNGNEKKPADGTVKED